jgi:hypothetical protein
MSGFGSGTTPVTGWGGSYASNNGHEGERLARQFRADFVAEVI